jgi:hypothetical protein
MYEYEKEIWAVLVEVAIRKTTIKYQQLSDLCNLGLDMYLPEDRMEIGHILGNISEYEHKNSRPLLSSVVVTDLAKGPGKGFYQLAEYLGLYSGPSNKQKQYEFWVKELAKVYEYWSRYKKKV